MKYFRQNTLLLVISFIIILSLLILCQLPSKDNICDEIIVYTQDFLTDKNYFCNNTIKISLSKNSRYEISKSKNIYRIKINTAPDDTVLYFIYSDGVIKRYSERINDKESFKKISSGVFKYEIDKEPSYSTSYPLQKNGEEICKSIIEKYSFEYNKMVELYLLDYHVWDESFGYPALLIVDNEYSLTEICSDVNNEWHFTKLSFAEYSEYDDFIQKHKKYSYANYNVSDKTDRLT